MAPDPAAVPLVLQTDDARHVENQLYPRGVMADARAGIHSALCGPVFRRADVKLVRVPLIPPAAVCPACVAIARRWYASYYFEPFTAVQRWRLLAVLGKDLEAVAA